MKVLALDISTKAGYAVLEGEESSLPKLVKYGVVVKGGVNIRSYGDYPYSFLAAAREMVHGLDTLINDIHPDVIVIEETNLAKARYSQKILEFIHALLLSNIYSRKYAYPVVYISSSQWRKTTGLEMTKEDKKNNKALKSAKEIAETLGTKVDKKALGVGGKVTKKHLSVRKANELFSLDFKVKDNDMADAILLGTSYFLGATVCDGIK